MTLIIALLILINLILWFVFFLKFKKLFSTDDIIQKTRDEYDLLLSDVNRNALQNIDLIDMKIEELKTLIEIADRRLSTVHSESQFQQAKEQISKPYSKRTVHRQEEIAAVSAVENDSAYNIDVDVKKSRKKNVSASNLEVEKTRKSTRKNSVTNTIPTEKTFQPQKTVNISDYKLPNIYMSDNPIQKKKSFQEQVMELYNAGYSVDQIAHELNKSTTEVELMVEML